MSQRFEQLGERLLRAGIAPRHVRRYLGELRDHFDDLLREETAAGMDRNAAQEAAHARIGSDEALAAVMLARPGLRSVAARYPWAMFGFGPVLMLFATMVAAILIELGFLNLLHHLFGGTVIHRVDPDWLKLLVAAWNGSVMYAAPLIIAALIGMAGIKQRMSTGWIVLGLAIVSVVGGGQDIAVRWSDGIHPAEFSASFLGPQYSQAMVMACVLRAAANLALVSSAYWLWLRRERSRFAP